MLSSTNPLSVAASPRLASTHGRQPSFLRLRLALRCPDPLTKYFYGRKACTLLGKASVSNFTVSQSLSSSEKHRLWPVCWLFLASWLPLRTLLRSSSSCSVTATIHSFGWHPTATVPLRSRHYSTVAPLGYALSSYCTASVADVNALGWIVMCCLVRLVLVCLAPPISS